MGNVYEFKTWNINSTKRQMLPNSIYRHRGDCQEMDMGLVSAIDAGKLLETQVVTRYSQAISMYVNLVHLYCSIQNIHKEHM